MTRLPNFVVIGAQKAGTTALCSALERHPDVHVHPEKELYFFTQHYDRGRGWYEDAFRDAGDAHAVGEGTPEYTQDEVRADRASRRMAETIPDAKLIYLVRDPIARIESSYYQWVDNGKALPPLREAVFSFDPLLAATRYASRLEAFRRFTSDDRILVLLFEDFRDRRVETLDRVCRFLEVDAIGDQLQSEARNARGERTRDRWPFVAALRRTRGFQAVRARLPTSWIRRGRSLYREPIAAQPRLEGDVRDRVLDAVRDEAERILAYADLPPDRWQLR